MYVQMSNSTAMWQILILDEDTMAKIPNDEKIPVKMPMFWNSKSNEEKEKIEEAVNKYIRHF